MAINVNIDARPIEDWRDCPTDRDVDTANLKLRLALEGIECYYPAHNNLIYIIHPQFGETHFDSWGTLLQHCNENWKTTYWGPQYRGVPVRIDRACPTSTMWGRSRL